MLKGLLFISLIVIAFQTIAQGPYAPHAGQANTTAMYKDSSSFISWATECVTTRGLQDISNPSGGIANVGLNNGGVGQPGANGVVSLGDGGSAILTFGSPIINGTGADFAVFENGFEDIGQGGYFLELAFVEVSSDGINFFRFEATSLTNTTTQTSSFGVTDATNINNLAGKYRVQYGTPFDLDELNGTPGLDINNITHVKIIDVVGNINPLYATYDSQNTPINDPWPTGFGSSGFDLDALGVIHSISNAVDVINNNLISTLYPNPIKDVLTINLNGNNSYNYTILNLSGAIMFNGKIKNSPHHIKLNNLSSGIYFLKVTSEQGVEMRKIVKY